jgi:parvulin-like peptidyl-prolyl isomerase
MATFVNGEEVKIVDIEQEVERMRSHYERVFKDQSKEEKESQLKEWAKENVIERILVTQAAKADPRPIDAKMVEKKFKELKKSHGGAKPFYKQFGLKKEDDPKIKADLELQMRVERIFEDNKKDFQDPKDSEAKEYFEQHLEEFMAPEQVRAAHIVKHIDGNRNKMQAFQEITGVEKQLESGKKFEDIADTNSDCPGNGGDLGYFARGQMVEEFEDAVFALQVGQVSSIIRSSYGYHIAKLYDRRPSQPVPFEQVKDQIIEHLKKERENKINEDYIDALKEKAIIEEK